MFNKRGFIVAFVLLVVVVVLGFYNTGALHHREDNNTQARISGSQLGLQRDVWIDVIKKDGPVTAYKQFLQEAPKNDAIDTHTHAHLFGEALYESEGLQGITTCDSAFEFGCYHSFLGTAIYYEGIDSLQEFDDACKKGDANDQYLPCQHGIGHGVLVYVGYEALDEALALCSKISNRSTGGCSSGVFMEYNFHTMDTVNDSSYLRPLTNNPYAPCDALAETYQPSCYYEQVQWWQNVYESNWQQIASLCSEINSNDINYRACFNGIGHYITASENYNYDTIVTQCALMPSEYSRALCHEGASWLLVSVQEYTEDAHNLCSDLQAPYAEDCLKKLN